MKVLLKTEQYNLRHFAPVSHRGKYFANLREKADSSGGLFEP